MANRKRRRYGECPYCPNVGKLTPDHVIPRCLFPKLTPVEEDRLIVDACEQCNNSLKSKDDDFLRDLLTIFDLEMSNHPLAKEAYASMCRSVKKDKSEVMRTIRRSTRTLWIDPTGLSTVKVLDVGEDTAVRMKSIFTTIIRGLHYIEFGEKLPNPTTFKVQMLESEKYVSYRKLIHAKGHRGCYSIGNGKEQVFTWHRGSFVSDKTVTFHLLNFYDSTFVSVFTNWPAKSKTEPQP